MAAPMDHHRKKKTCDIRPAYRDGRREKAVKVYTINQESRYLLVQDVPDIKVTDELIKLFSLYGTIEEYRILEDFPVEAFTKAYWVKYVDLQAARVAKRKLDDRPFYGACLHVTYAPEYETVDDTRRKLQERRKGVARRLRRLKQEGTENTTAVSEENPSALATQDSVKDCINTPTIGPKKPDSARQTSIDLHQSTSQSSKTPPDDNVAEIPQYLPAPPKHLPVTEWTRPETSHDQYPRLPTAHATLPRNFNPYPDDHKTEHAGISTDVGLAKNISINITVQDGSFMRGKTATDTDGSEYYSKGARPKLKLREDTKGHSVVSNRTNQWGRSKFLARIAWGKNTQSETHSTRPLASAVDTTSDTCTTLDRTAHSDIPTGSKDGPTIVQTSSFVPRQLLRKRKHPSETEHLGFGLACGGEASNILKRGEHLENESSSGGEIPSAAAGESFDRTVQNIRRHMRNVSQGSGNSPRGAQVKQELRADGHAASAPPRGAGGPSATKRLRI